MIYFLTTDEIIRSHDRIIAQSGGALGIRDLGALESAVAQPQMTFGGEALYPTLVDRAGALAFSLTMNHPFVDGNKRVAWVAMRVFLRLNGWDLIASIDDAEQTMLALAAGELSRQTFTEWLQQRAIELV